MIRQSFLVIDIKGMGHSFLIGEEINLHALFP